MADSPPLAVRGAVIEPWSPGAGRLVPTFRLPHLENGQLSPALLDDVNAFLRTRSRSAATERTYRLALTTFLKDLAGREVTPAVVEGYLADLLTGVEHSPLKPASVQLRLAVARSWFAWLQRDGRLPYNPCRAVKAPVREADQRRARAMTWPEVLALLDAPPTRGVIGRRDRALLAVGLTCGMRRSELVALTRGCLEPGAKGLRLRFFAAKSGEERLCPLLPRVEGEVERYLELRTGVGESSPLFATHRRLGASGEAPLHRSQVDEIVRRWALAAGVTVACERRSSHRHAGRVCQGRKPSISAHSLRATYVTQLLQLGVPLQDVRKAVGHANVETTSRYDRGELQEETHPSWALGRLFR